MGELLIHPNSNARTIIIRGPIGVGKSTVAHILRDRLAPAVRISVDTLRYLVHPRILDHRSLRVAKSAAGQMAVRYNQAGFTCIIESVFEDPLTLEELTTTLDRAGVRWSLFTLGAPPMVLRERNRARESFQKSPTERVDQTYEASAWEAGEMVETGDKIAEEVAVDILKRLEKSLGKPVGVPTSEKKYCLFVRHGEYESDQKRYPVAGEGALTLRGRAQIRLVAEQIAQFRPERIVASPFQRARESAEIIAREVGCQIEYDADLRERYLEALSGMPLDQITERYSSMVVNLAYERSEALELPDCETMQEAEARVQAAMQRVLTATRERVAVVSHGGPHSWLCCRYLGVAPRERARQVNLAQGSYSVFEYERDGAFSSIKALNSSVGIPLE